MGEKRRILVAVEPIVLEGALSVILEDLGVDEVVRFHTGPAPAAGTAYDAAVVSIDLPDGLRPHVVITLPGTTGDHRGARLTVGDVSTEVHLPTHHEVVDLLDDCVPAAASRALRLHRLSHAGSRASQSAPVPTPG